MIVTANPLTWNSSQAPAIADEATLRAYFERIKYCTPQERTVHSDFIAARNRLIEIHSRVIKIIAEKYFNKHPWSGLTAQDFISDARLGAIDAASRYDGSVKFLSFAGLRILGQIRDTLRRENFDSTRLTGQPGEKRKGLFRYKRLDTNGRVLSLDHPLYENDNKAVAFGDTLSNPLSDERTTRLAEGEEWAELQVFLAQALPFAPQRSVRAFLSYLSGKTMKQVGKEIGLSETRVSQMISNLPKLIKPALEKIVWGKPHSFAVIDELKYSRSQDLYLFRAHVPMGQFKIVVHGVSPNRLCGPSVDIGIASTAECLPISAADFAEGVFNDQSFTPAPLDRNFIPPHFRNTHHNTEDTMTTTTTTDTSTQNTVFSAPSLLSALGPSLNDYGQIIVEMIQEPQTPIATIVKNRRMLLTWPLRVEILRCILPNADSLTAARMDNAEFRTELRVAAMAFYKPKGDGPNPAPTYKTSDPTANGSPQTAPPLTQIPAQPSPPPR
jgi:RNA polymerase sigma factor (sigma-70 family)